MNTNEVLNKLKYEIERRNLSNYHTTMEGYEEELYEIIDSLQQEQPQVADASKTEQSEGYLEYWLEHFGMPKENIENCADQIAQGYGASRYLEGVQVGAEAVNELGKQEKGYDEAYLNECIAKASKTWEGVDADKYMDEVRGREPEIDFEQALYNHFGQVKDFTLGMRIAAYFYELGKKSLK